MVSLLRADYHIIATAAVPSSTLWLWWNGTVPSYISVYAFCNLAFHFTFIPFLSLLLSCFFLFICVRQVSSSKLFFSSQRPVCFFYIQNYNKANVALNFLSQNASRLRLNKQDFPTFSSFNSYFCHWTVWLFWVWNGDLLLNILITGFRISVRNHLSWNLGRWFWSNAIKNYPTTNFAIKRKELTEPMYKKGLSWQISFWSL